MGKPELGSHQLGEDEGAAGGRVTPVTRPSGARSAGDGRGEVLNKPFKFLVEETRTFKPWFNRKAVFQNRNLSFKILNRLNRGLKQRKSKLNR